MRFRNLIHAADHGRTLRPAGLPRPQGPASAPSAEAAIDDGGSEVLSNVVDRVV